MTTRYDAVISRKDKDGKVRYTKIGAAFPAKDGKDGFNIVLDALPMPNAEGQAWISLYVPKPKEGQKPATSSEPLNDDIPY
jgi:hypothetical protein